MGIFTREAPVATTHTVVRCGGWSEREYPFRFVLLLEGEATPIGIEPLGMRRAGRDVREDMALTSPGDRVEILRRESRIVGFRNLTLEGIIGA